ncbi:DUF2282 domain-containing protein, partial [Vibrio vulnificus]
VKEMEERQLKRSGKDGSNYKPSLKATNSLCLLNRTCDQETGSCAGTAKEDNQKDAFVVVPKGLCGKLAGGNTQSS